MACMQRCIDHDRREAAPRCLYERKLHIKCTKEAQRHALRWQLKVWCLYAAFLYLLLLLAGPLEASSREDSSILWVEFERARQTGALSSVLPPSSATSTLPAAISAATATLYTPNPQSLSRPSKAPSLPNNHPLKFAFHCLEGNWTQPPSITLGSPEHLVPANYTAYTQHSEAASLLPLELWQSTKQPPQQILTVVSAVTPKQLKMLQEQCKSWPGPLSAILYAPVVDSSAQVPEPGVLTDAQWDTVRPAYDAMQAVFTEMESAANTCALTAMLIYEHVQEDMVHQLPLNSVRNLGLLLARTPLVAVLNVDLLVSSTLADSLINPPEAADILNRLLGQRAFMVIPTFNPPEAARRDARKASGSSVEQMATQLQQQMVAQLASRSNKEELQRLMDSNLLEIFDGKTNRQGHWETDFRSWFRCQSPPCPSYNIAPISARFEPWGMLDRRMALDHPYDELYRGYGKAKISNLMLLRHQNFTMMVHGSGFLVHRPHEVSTAKKLWMAELGTGRTPLNAVRFETMQAAMRQGTYAPTVAPVTAGCMSRTLDVGAAVPSVSQVAVAVKRT